VGVEWTVQQLAEKICEIEEEDERIAGKHVYGVADPAIFASDGGPSIAEQMEEYGIYFDKAENKRIPGKMQCHYRLAFDEDGIPMFYVFNTCKHFIRTIPALLYSETDVEDVDTKMEDHAYDEWRYVNMSRPIAPRAKVTLEKEWTPPPDDPLNLNTDDYEYDTFTLLMNS
jgi:hypothetical protein